MKEKLLAILILAFHA